MKNEIPSGRIDLENGNGIPLKALTVSRRKPAYLNSRAHARLITTPREPMARQRRDRFIRNPSEKVHRIEAISTQEIDWPPRAIKEKKRRASTMTPARGE